MQKFKIYEIEGVQFIEHLQFPRFKAHITFSDKTSDLQNINLIDDCLDVKLLSKTMREAGEYILSRSK